MNRQKLLQMVIAGLTLSAMAQSSWAVTPQAYTYTGSNTWVNTINSATTGATGSITFNDWGYKGPTNVGVNDFVVTSTVTGVTGFDSSRIGQIQTVTTVAPDWLTTDPAKSTKPYLVPFGTTYANGNMDGQVNFYKMAYTTPTSTFTDMQIDKAGNYSIARSDMNFGFYDTFAYKSGANPVVNIDTDLNFQPYAISDAKGWCGSVLTSGANSLEVMAGQVTFDFAFDAYFGNAHPGDTAPATQIVPGFVMRSYGDYTVNVTNNATGYNMNFEGHAVGNNTDPTTVVAGVGGSLDPAFQNKVSFLGAGVVPKGAWVFNDGTSNVTVSDDQSNPGVNSGDVRLSDGATWHYNDFGGFAFLLRADAGRVVTFISSTGFSDYAVASVPVPAAAWLLGSGLIGLAGVARKRRKSI